MAYLWELDAVLVSRARLQKYIARDSQLMDLAVDHTDLRLRTIFALRTDHFRHNLLLFQPEKAAEYAPLE